MGAEPAERKESHSRSHHAGLTFSRFGPSVIQHLCEHFRDFTKNTGKAAVNFQLGGKLINTAPLTFHLCCLGINAKLAHSVSEIQPGNTRLPASRLPGEPPPLHADRRGSCLNFMYQQREVVLVDKSRFVDIQLFKKFILVSRKKIRSLCFPR